MTTPTAIASTALTPELARRVSRVANTCLAVIAIIAAVLSYTGLHTLALHAGVPPMLTWLVPIVVDGLVLASSVTLIAETLAGLSTAWSWCLITAGVTMSVVGNVLAAPPGLIDGAVHAMPPLVMAASLESVLRLLRHRAGRPVRRARRAATQSASTTGTRPPRQPDSVPPPKAQPSAPKQTDTPAQRTSSTRDDVAAILAAEPTISAAAIARRIRRDPSHISKLVRELTAPSGMQPTGTDG